MTNPEAIRDEDGAFRTDPRFVAFVGHFNVDRDYFECHELMEELWLENGRNPVLQGLLQAAVGQYHWRNGNRGGAVKLFAGALRKLQGAPAVQHGVDLEALRAAVRSALQTLYPVPADASDPDAVWPPDRLDTPPTTDAPFRPFPLVVTDEALARAVEAWAAQAGRPADGAHRAADDGAHGDNG